MDYKKDKVYLRQRKKGIIYPFDAYLAKNPNFERVVPNPSEKDDNKKGDGKEKSKGKQKNKADK